MMSRGSVMSSATSKTDVLRKKEESYTSLCPYYWCEQQLFNVMLLIVVLIRITTLSFNNNVEKDPSEPKKRKRKVSS